MGNLIFLYRSVNFHFVQLNSKQYTARCGYDSNEQLNVFNFSTCSANLREAISTQFKCALTLFRTSRQQTDFGHEKRTWIVWLFVRVSKRKSCKSNSFSSRFSGIWNDYISSFYEQDFQSMVCLSLISYPPKILLKAKLPRLKLCNFIMCVFLINYDNRRLLWLCEIYS